YIWSRTIPMLKDTLIIGYGPDNFPMVFPQEDYVGRFNVGNEGMLNIVIDKPHNMYLQTAVNTGVISLLALLAIWGIYIFDSLKIYLKGNMETFAEYMGAATFLSITAYLVAGLFNDSIVSVAPLFWILLGMGIGINKMIKVVPDNK
ncbi:MAG TPA: O-antigen ligase family protein, partial [Sedimentibacter sp.]|nr:O-antigen ligase family protein [Sedimentibacter sp.]